MSRGKIFATVLVAAIAATPASVAAQATNLAQKPGPAGCITENGSAGACRDGRGLVGSTAIALSPDGENAYVASSDWDSLSILTRNPLDGGLAPVDNPDGCFDTLPANYSDCTKTRALGGAEDVAVSHDGKSVYVISLADDAIVEFQRDPSTGLLTPIAGEEGCIDEGGTDECAGGHGLDALRSVVVSPDDESVYVASSGTDGGVEVFDRNTTTGVLTQKPGTAACFNVGGTDGCAKGPPELLDTRGLAVSPDGKNVYAGSRVHDAVTVFDRAADGALMPKAGSARCVSEEGEDGCVNGAALIDPDAIAAGPEGETVYVAASRSDAIAVFDRNPTTGDLTQKPGTAGCISNTGASNPMQAGTLGACQDGSAMDGPDSIAILPDGSALYAATENSDGLAVFERNADGTIVQRPGTAGCITDSGYEDENLYWTAGACGDGSALLGASDVVASEDSEHAYTAARLGGVGIFDVVSPPPAPLPPVGPTKPGPPATGPTPECVTAKASLRRNERLVVVARHAMGKKARSTEPSVVRRARGLVKRRRAAAQRARQRALSLCGTS
jgi:DNA-binding beta-propeller fold protein YncE